MLKQRLEEFEPDECLAIIYVRYKSKYKKVGVLPIRIVKSNVSSVSNVSPFVREKQKIYIRYSLKVNDSHYVLASYCALVEFVYISAISLLMFIFLKDE